MIESIKSLVTGALVGVIFALFSLPIPAPSVLPGILGIVGIFVGFYIVKHFIR